MKNRRGQGNPEYGDKSRPPETQRIYGFFPKRCLALTNDVRISYMSQSRHTLPGYKPIK